MHVNNSVTVKTVGGISLCDGGKLEESEGYNYFLAVFVCVFLFEIDQLSVLKLNNDTTYDKFPSLDFQKINE